MANVQINFSSVIAFMTVSFTLVFLAFLASMETNHAIHTPVHDNPTANPTISPTVDPTISGWSSDFNERRTILEKLHEKSSKFQYAGHFLGKNFTDDQTSTGCFIVQMKGNLTAQVTTENVVYPNVQAAIDALKKAFENRTCVNGNPAVTIGHIYDDAMAGFSGCFCLEALELILETESVKMVVQDTYAKTTAVQNLPAEQQDAQLMNNELFYTQWNLDAIDPTSGQGKFDTGDLDGSNVNIFVLDNGFNPDSDEWKGRLKSCIGPSKAYKNKGGYEFSPDDFVPYEQNGEEGCMDDMNGHGSICAGLAVGTTWGVAKKANLHGIRIFSDPNLGSSLSLQLAGIDHVMNVVQAEQLPSIISMSIGAPCGGRLCKPSLLDKAITHAVESGIAVVVAAGNDADADTTDVDQGGVKPYDCCMTSPASSQDAFTVGATTVAGRRVTFSEVGACLNINAPGTAVIGANCANSNAVNGECWPALGATGYNKQKGGTSAATAWKAESGTSQATPMVAGVLALQMEHMIKSGMTYSADRAWVEEAQQALLDAASTVNMESVHQPDVGDVFQPYAPANQLASVRCGANPQPGDQCTTDAFLQIPATWPKGCSGNTAPSQVSCSSGTVPCTPQYTPPSKLGFCI